MILFFGSRMHGSHITVGMGGSLEWQPSRFLWPSHTRLLDRYGQRGWTLQQPWWYPLLLVGTQPWRWQQEKSHLTKLCQKQVAWVWWISLQKNTKIRLWPESFDSRDNKSGSVLRCDVTKKKWNNCDGFNLVRQEPSLQNKHATFWQQFGHCNNITIKKILRFHNEGSF